MNGRAAALLRPAVAAIAMAATLACAKPDTPSGEPPSGGDASQDAGVGSVQALIDQGRLDEALQRVSERPQDPESLYLMGRIWAKKAEKAPLPTPPPAASPLPRGVQSPLAPEFKPEELQAIAFFEKAVAARPDYAPTHVALAELLSPHALRRQAVQKPEADPGKRRRGRPPVAPPPQPDTGGVDVSVDRVIRAYQFAMQADATSVTLPEALIGFGLQAGRNDAAEMGHRELLKRAREKPEPFIRYGDFLLNHKQDQEGAIEQYRQALIWKADDDGTRAKIAEIYLTRGIQRFGSAQFAMAEQEFQQAAKWITDRSSPQAQRLAEYTARLREIRVR